MSIRLFEKTIIEKGSGAVDRARIFLNQALLNSTAIAPCLRYGFLEHEGWLYLYADLDCTAEEYMRISEEMGNVCDPEKRRGLEGVPVMPESDLLEIIRAVEGSGINAEEVNRAAYLGDGVYATFDGGQIWLDLRGQDTTTRIALNDEVFSRLTDYAKRFYG